MTKQFIIIQSRLKIKTELIKVQPKSKTTTELLQYVKLRQCLYYLVYRVHFSIPNILGISTFAATNIFKKH